MGAPGRKVGMEGEKMKESEETSTATMDVAVESPRDQFAWAQYLHDAQFFDLSAFSPKGLMITPRESPGSFPDLGAICPSPLFADQLQFLQSWSPRITNSSDSPPPDHPPSVAEELLQIQSLHLARVSNSEPGASVSVTTSCESEGPSSSSEVKLGTSTADSTGSGYERTRSRKRKSPELEKAEPENVDDASDADEVEDSKDIADKPSRSKQKKVKGPKRLKEPRIAIKTRTDVDILEDGYKWRKYGQKPVKNSPHPRNYYRCTTANCPVRKRVERSLEDPGLVVTSYEGTHTHPKVNPLPKRTASGGFAPLEAAESLSESLKQLQNRQQQAASTSAAPPQFPQLPNLRPNPALMNLQLPSGALQDNVGLMLAYQILRLQHELQAKMQQFMSYSAQAGGGNSFTDPFGFLQQSLSVPDLMGMMSSNSDSGDAEMKFPKVPEALNSGSLLARRAAQRTGSPLNPNLESSAVKMQQLMAQAMAGLQQEALEQQERLGEGQGADQGQ